MVIVRILFSNRKSIIGLLLGEAEIMCGADCWSMETVATKCRLESTVWLSERGYSSLSAQLPERVALSNTETSETRKPGL